VQANVGGAWGRFQHGWGCPSADLRRLGVHRKERRAPSPPQLARRGAGSALTTTSAAVYCPSISSSTGLIRSQFGANTCAP
jgi:hypothetical protein